MLRRSDFVWKYGYAKEGIIAIFSKFCNNNYATGCVAPINSHLVPTRNYKNWHLVPTRNYRNYTGQMRPSLGKVVSFTFSEGLPFDVVNDPDWLSMVDGGIAVYGTGNEPRSMQQLRDEERFYGKQIHSIVADYKQIWKEYGCTVMVDGWTFGRIRAFVFRVNSPGGTPVLKYVIVSDTVENGDLLVDYIDDVVQLIGEENVIQVVTNNVCEKAGKKLMEKRKNLWWSPCPRRSIDFMLEDISNLKIYKQTIKMANRVMKYIYGHTIPLYQTKGGCKEVYEVTSFAYAFLTLHSLCKKKQSLEALVSSKKWANSDFHANKLEGEFVKGIVLNDPNFWPNLEFCVKSVVPLICVIRELDLMDRPPIMGYIYELMNRAKDKIKLDCGQEGPKKKEYAAICKKIDSRWAPLLHHPLLAAGYYLNPKLRYEEKFLTNPEIKQGLYACMDKMLSPTERVKADIQLQLYNDAQGEFGCAVAIKSRMSRSPAGWWKLFTSEAPELASFAIKVLSLTCNATRFETHWEPYETVHPRNWNRQFKPPRKYEL